jgi:hypothetical protein
MPMTSHDEGWRVEDAPRVRPLTYPGRWPTTSILLTEHTHHELRPDMVLDDALAGHGVAPMAERTPVVAVGSNASPAQLRHKFGTTGTSLVMPLVLTEIEGLASVFSPNVSSVGYLPTTALIAPGLRDRLFVQWLDREQLARLDATEGGYQRPQLPAGVRVTGSSGQAITGCHAYVDDKGYLVDDEGRPRRLGDQRALLTDLLARSAQLRQVMGPSPEAWVAACRDKGRRLAAEQILRDEGWVAGARTEG